MTDTKELYNQAHEYASECIALAEKHEPNLLIIAAAAQLMGAFALSASANIGPREQFCRDLQRVLAEASKPLRDEMEGATRMLPGPLPIAELAETLMVMSVLRTGNSLTQALIALTAVCVKLADLIGKATGCTDMALANTISEEVERVCSALSDSIYPVIHSTDQKDAN